MSASSPYVVTPSGELKPPRRLALSPRRVVAACRQLFNPLTSFDPTTIRFDARAIDAELMAPLARGEHHLEASTDVIFLNRAN